MKKFVLPLMNESYDSNNIAELTPILFEYMRSEGMTEFRHTTKYPYQCTNDDLDVLGYNSDDLDNVLKIHFYGNYEVGLCFILEYKTFLYDVKSVVNEALKKDTMNEAVLLIQEFLGVTDGFSASLFFSGIDEDYYDNMEFSKRKNLLLDYIKHEILY